MSLTTWIIVISVIAAIVAANVYYSYYTSEKNLRELEESEKIGRNIPSSLHPEIDEGKCIGCGACVEACPEKTVLGLIYGKAKLINASDCVGHGACFQSCPSEAITLVLGTKKHGVEIPLLTPDYQTNVPGLYIAGELAGMGLIVNTVRQGKLATEYIVKSLKNSNGNNKGVLDLLIVGSGPTGLAAALKAKELDLKNFVILEQADSIGGTIRNFPRKKILLLDRGIEFPLCKPIKKRVLKKEELMEIFEEIYRKHQLPVKFRERVVDIKLLEEGLFSVQTESGEEYLAKRVLLSVGRRGSPRKLGVKGEEQPKVFYELREPEEFRGNRCLVVGGGDSAIEIALMLADEPGTEVTLSYRGDKIWRAKRYNLEKINSYIEKGKVRAIFNSTISEIREEYVTLKVPSGEKKILNDYVFVMIGGTLPTEFLHKIGVETRKVYGEKFSI